MCVCKYIDYLWKVTQEFFFPFPYFSAFSLASHSLKSWNAQDSHYNPSSILTLGDLTMDTLTNSQICTSNKASPESTFTSSKMSCSFYCILSLGYPIEIKLSSWPTHLHYSQTYLFILIFSISVTSNPLLVVQVKSLITPDFSQHTVHKELS